MLLTIHKIVKNASENENLKKISLKYIAFENNKNLISEISSMLINKLEFMEVLDTNSNIKLYNGVIKAAESDVYIDITVHIISEDFMSDIALKILNSILLNDKDVNDDKDLNSDKQVIPRYNKERPSVDLFVGCCVADLVHPSALAAQVYENA
jgi:hypothetical protein